MNNAFAEPFDALASLKQGARPAQALFYQQFSKPLFHLLRKMTDDDTAADLLQDSFLQAFKSVHQYREQAPIGFWLRQIAINKVWMHHRQRQRYVEDPCFEHVEAPQVDHLADQQLEDLLKYLSPVARTVVWLYHVEGYSHEEIADMQGKSLSFSKSQLSRAHQKLRHLLEEGS